MRYLVGLVLALATVASPLSVSAQAGEGGAASEPASAVSLVHAYRSLPPLLTLQASDYVVDVDPLSAQPTVVPKKEEVPPTPEERERTTRNRNIGLGIGLGVGIPLVIGIAAGVTAANFSF